MTTPIEYALMAGAAYIDTRDPKNRLPSPQGWVQSNHKSESSGFEAITFQNGNQIVISYTGTYVKDRSGDIATDLALAAGNICDQLRQAADYYPAIKNDQRYQECNITLAEYSQMTSTIFVFVVANDASIKPQWRVS